MTYTKEQKQERSKALRERWAKNKAAAEQDKDAKAKYDAIQMETPNYTISYTGFYFTLLEMQSQGLQGIPYIDTKTFNGWKQSGFKVKKGEHSTIKGLTWIKAQEKEGSEYDTSKPFLFPKEYALFHKTQVEAI